MIFYAQIPSGKANGFTFCTLPSGYSIDFNVVETLCSNGSQRIRLAISDGTLNSNISNIATYAPLPLSSGFYCEADYIAMKHRFDFGNSGIMIIQGTVKCGTQKTGGAWYTVSTGLPKPSRYVECRTLSTEGLVMVDSNGNLNFKPDATVPQFSEFKFIYVYAYVNS